MTEQAQQDSGRTIGIGTVRKYDPAVLVLKTKIEKKLVAQGLTGVALEEAALEELQRVHKSSFYEEMQARNTLVNGGTAIMLDGLIGVAITYYTNALAALGVGDSAAAFALGQTNLQGAVVTTDRIRKAMDATFPSRAANVMSFRSTFATTEANFVWNEWAVFNAVADATGTMLNRSVANLGTKTSAAAWQLLATITQN